MQPLQLKAPDRFSMIRVLGEGATGRVFEVEDNVRRGRFAAKRLRSERFTSADQIARFKDEFRTLKRVAHPNLVKLYELISNSDGTYILMELIDGLNFVQHGRNGLDRQPTARLPTASEEDLASASPCGGEVCIERVRSATPQLVNGLLALHATGKVHCDIKPDNVMVAQDGRVVILDFGLTTEGTHKFRIDKFRGTPAFMAPEQAEGIISEAADWYAAGTLLYLTLCGQLPFGSSTQAKRFGKPVDPRLIEPSIPDDLAALVLHLLEPNPGARPTDQELAALFELPYTHSSRDGELPFVGRELELAQLRQNLDAAVENGTRIVHVHGESGIGKTSLIKHFTKSAEARGSIVLRGSCYVEASVPYKGLDNVVDRLASDLERLGVQPSASERAALSTLFSVFGPYHRDEELDRRRARARAVDALYALLRRLSDKAAIVIAIDDFQWADVDSIELLSDVLAGPGLRRVLIMLVYRSLQDGAGDVLRHARVRLAPHHELALGRLAEGAISTLVGDKLEERELKNLAYESRGNPFFLGELLRARGERRTREVLRLEEVLASRIDGLPHQQRAYLELVSVAGRPLDESILARALGTSWMDMLEARYSLAAASFIRAGESPAQTVEPYHDRVRDHVLDALSAADTRGRHLALAEAYENAGMTDSETLAVHYRAAGEAQKALYHLERAGDAAARVLAFEHAAHLYDLACGLAEGGGQNGLRLKYARALSNAGRASQAASLFAQALAEQPDDVNLILATGDQFLRAGEIRRGVSFLNLVAMTFKESIPETTWSAGMALLRGMLKLAFRLRAPLSDSPIGPTDQLRLDLYYSVAKRLGYLDTIRAVLFQVRYLSFALKLGSRPDVVGGSALVGASFSHAHSAIPGIPRLARWLLACADANARESDRLSVRIAVELAWGMLELGTWRWQHALRRFDRALAIANSKGAYGLQWEIVYCESMALLVLWIEGDIPAIRRRIQTHSTTTSEYLGIEGKEVLRISAIIELMDDRPEEAYTSVLRTMRMWPSESWSFQHHTSAVALADIEHYQGRWPEAWRRLETSWKESLRAGVFTVQYVYLAAVMLRARIGLAYGRTREARRDIRTLKRRKDAWASAIGEVLGASLLAAEGRTQAAAAALSRAIPILQANRIGLYALSARYRLAQLRGTAGEQQSVLDELTALTIRNPKRLVDCFLPWPNRAAS